MKRPLFIAAIAMLIGIGTANILNSLILFVLAGAICFLLLIVFRKQLKVCLKLSIILVLIFLFGGFEYLYINIKNTERFEGYHGKEVEVRGYIAAEPDIRSHKVTYVVKTREVVLEGQSKRINGKLILTTLKKKDGTIFDYGDSIGFTGQLTEPSGQKNPGGFNYKSYLAQSGISACIFVNSEDIKLFDTKETNQLFQLGINIRNNIIDIVNHCLPKEQAGLLNGMLIGYRAGLSKETQQDFSDAGLTHLMAVSGMNVAFIVFPMVFIFKKLRIREELSNTIIIFVLCIFVLVTGFSPSILRAAIMAAVLLLAKILRREADVLTSLAFAAFVLMVWNPMSVFDIGFQLSFAATLSIVLFYKRISEIISSKGIPGYISSLISVTASAQLGTTPITAYYFNKLSLISVISNLIVVPFVEVITIIGFIMVLLGQVSIFAAQLAGYINNAFLSFILFVTKMSAKLPFSTIMVLTPPVLLIIAYYIFICLWLKKDGILILRNKSWIYLTVAFVIIAGIVLSAFIPRDLEVVFLDVGQGDSALVRTPKGKNILIDGGGTKPIEKDSFNVGEAVVIPFLLDHGVWKLDAVVATHAHDDHIQGLKPVLDKYAVDSLIVHEGSYDTMKELTAIVDRRGIRTDLCEKGDVIRVDDEVLIKVLHPKKVNEAVNSTLNNSSLVLKLKYENMSVLFTGDIEAEVEDMLLPESRELKSDVLKVAHHGSITSSSEAFLKAVAPKAAVISVGRNNFGHPSGTVLERLYTLKTKLFRTDINGAIIMKSDGDRIEFITTVK